MKLVTLVPHRMATPQMVKVMLFILMSFSITSTILALLMCQGDMLAELIPKKLKTTIQSLTQPQSYSTTAAGIFDSDSSLRQEVLRFERRDVKAIPYDIITSVSENILSFVPPPLTAEEIAESPELSSPLHDPDLPLDPEQIDWSQFAYATYSTSSDYLKSALLNAKRLRQFNTQADIVIMHATTAKDDFGIRYEHRLLAKAIDKYDVKIFFVDALDFEGDEANWAKGFTKFHVFSLVQIE
ncbi:unnamed protein product [Ambrosiozyma monospora]|uniref:Unnamed protein product n=1 Tax=Ambrosiozyma monospora TaxID=43982 RepID=A0ACB5U2W4_AMBMO|nr:unnamed protein product [Ambrosiozyma monospora]